MTGYSSIEEYVYSIYSVADLRALIAPYAYFLVCLRGPRVPSTSTQTSNLSDTLTPGTHRYRATTLLLAVAAVVPLGLEASGADAGM